MFQPARQPVRPRIRRGGIEHLLPASSLSRQWALLLFAVEFFPLAAVFIITLSCYTESTQRTQAIDSLLSFRPGEVSEASLDCDGDCASSVSCTYSPHAHTYMPVSCCSALCHRSTLADL